MWFRNEAIIRAPRRARAAYKHPSKSLVVCINGIAAPVWLFKTANISSEEEEVESVHAAQQQASPSGNNHPTYFRRDTA